MVVLLKIEGNCSCLGAKVAHMVGHLPGTTNSIMTGIEKTSGARAGYCGGSQNVLYYVVVAFGPGGSGDQIYSGCFRVPSNDINNYVYFKVAPYASEGGGMLVQIFSVTYNGTGQYAAQYIPYAYGVLHSYSRITRSSTVFGNPINGHWMWGVDWKYASYAHSDGTLAYQQRNFDQDNGYSPPMGFYWHNVPASGNNGGDLYNCVYDGLQPQGCSIGR